MIEDVKKNTESIINEILEEGINQDNIDMLGKVIDIHKDVENEEYWKVKEEFMMYRDRGYGDYPSMNYGARRRDSRGRYMEGGNYGNYGRRYRGHDMIDDMSDNYGRYEEGKEQYGRGNYGAKEDTMKSLEYMLQSVEDFMCMLAEDAQSQEEVEMIKHTARKIAEM